MQRGQRPSTIARTDWREQVEDTRLQEPQEADQRSGQGRGAANRRGEGDSATLDGGFRKVRSSQEAKEPSHQGFEGTILHW